LASRGGKYNTCTIHLLLIVSFFYFFSLTNWAAPFSLHSICFRFVSSTIQYHTLPHHHREGVVLSLLLILLVYSINLQLLPCRKYADTLNTISMGQCLFGGEGLLNGTVVEEKGGGGGGWQEGGCSSCTDIPTIKNLC